VVSCKRWRCSEICLTALSAERHLSFCCLYCAPRLPYHKETEYHGFPSNLLVIMMKTQTSTRVQAPGTLSPATRTDALSRPRASMTSGTQSPSWDGARPMNGAAARDKPTSLDLRTEFRIGTWNVLTLAKTGYTEAICQNLVNTVLA